MASYDDLGKIKKSAYILEKGTYKVTISMMKADDTTAASMANACIAGKGTLAVAEDGSAKLTVPIQAITMKVMVSGIQISRPVMKYFFTKSSCEACAVQAERGHAVAEGLPEGVEECLGDGKEHRESFQSLCRGTFCRSSRRSAEKTSSSRRSRCCAS